MSSDEVYNEDDAPEIEVADLTATLSNEALIKIGRMAQARELALQIAAEDKADHDLTVAEGKVFMRQATTQTS